MASLRSTMVSFVKKGLSQGSVLHRDKFIKFAKLSLMAVPMRQISTLEVTKNLSIVSNEKKNLKISTSKVIDPLKKPLVVLNSWLMAKEKHLNKYMELYLNQGFDVLCVRITPWQLLWPTKGTQLVAADILRFLEKNALDVPLVVHGFSVGGYLWGEVLVQMAAEQNRYQHIVDRIAGQVWDSVAEVTEVPLGVPIAVFPQNVVMQKALQQYLMYHLKAFDKLATRHYVRSSQMFHTSLVHAPALFIISKTDPIATERANMRVKDNWENMGIQVHWKCFDSSPHVGHFHKHPAEYRAALFDFLKSIDIAQNNKVQAKM